MLCLLLWLSLCYKIFIKFTWILWVVFFNCNGLSMWWEKQPTKSQHYRGRPSCCHSETVQDLHRQLRRLWPSLVCRPLDFIQRTAAPTTSTPKSSRCIYVCVCVSSSVGGQERARRDLVLGGPAISSHSFLNLCSNVTGDKSSLPAHSALFENISHLRTQNTACSMSVCSRGSSGCTEGGSCHLNYPSTCGVNMCQNVCLCVCVWGIESLCVYGGGGCCGNYPPTPLPLKKAV